MDRDIEIKVTDELSKKIAEMAIAQIPDERMKVMVDNAVRLFPPKDTNYYSYNVTTFHKKVIEHMTEMVDNKIADILCNEKYETLAEETAQRIVKNARDAAEKYMTESIAQRMCVSYTDFKNADRHHDIIEIVHEIMSRQYT